MAKPQKISTLIPNIMSELFYQTAYNYKPGKGRENIETESKTVPNKTRTIKEIVNRYKAGMPPEMKNVQYFDEEELEKINRFYRPGAFDLTDIEALAERTRELEHIVQQALNKKEQEQKQEARDRESIEPPLTPDPTKPETEEKNEGEQ